MISHTAAPKDLWTLVANYLGPCGLLHRGAAARVQVDTDKDAEKEDTNRAPRKHFMGDACVMPTHWQGHWMGGQIVYF